MLNNDPVDLLLSMHIAMRTSILIIAAGLFLPTMAQPFAIGSVNITFNDPSRNGRSIPCEVYYPATNAGAAQPVADGIFPILAFGHGFVMGVGSYANMWQAFVPQGYIMVLPTTEGGFSPSHNELGLDLAYVIGAMQQRGTDPGSPFFNRVASTAAIMGHSMGGGASFHGASSPLVTTVVNYAAAETNPSAIAAAGTLDKPVLVFAGSQDCVTPAATNQLPMYNAVPSGCKAFINITNGGHCNFANSNFNCEFGQFTCGGGGSLGRPGQQAIAHSYTLLWLDRYLKDDEQAGAQFSSLIATSSGISAQSILSDCPPIRVRVDVKLFLDGAYEAGTGLMRDDLRSNGLLPASEPYTAAGFDTDAPGQQMDIDLLALSGPEAIVDWVLIQLRSANDPTNVIRTSNGLLLRNGMVVATNGDPTYFDVPAGGYFVAARHRNHLGVMTASPMQLHIGMQLLDLSDPVTGTYGTGARKISGGIACLWSGDTNGDGQLRYTGSSNDRDAILQRIGGIIPTAGVPGYHMEDADLDGVVRYTGPDNDRDHILSGIGGIIPTASRTQQLP